MRASKTSKLSRSLTKFILSKFVWFIHKTCDEVDWTDLSPARLKTGECTDGYMNYFDRQRTHDLLFKPSSGLKKIQLYWQKYNNKKIIKITRITGNKHAWMSRRIIFRSSPPIYPPLINSKTTEKKKVPEVGGDDVKFFHYYNFTLPVSEKNQIHYNSINL